jgi:predicted HD phosphohydrolase
MGLKLGDIEKLFRDHGDSPYSGEPVTQLEHALQAAHLAEAEEAPDRARHRRTAHDLGHLLNQQGDTRAHAASTTSISISHPVPAAPVSAGGDRADRLHVDAKRALCALEPEYYEASPRTPSAASRCRVGCSRRRAPRRSSPSRMRRTRCALRRWDDAAKVAGAATPPLAHYWRFRARCAT